MMDITRRNMMLSGAVGSVAAAFGIPHFSEKSMGECIVSCQDESFWGWVAAQYSQSSSLLDLSCSIPALRSVSETYDSAIAAFQHQEWVRVSPSLVRQSAHCLAQFLKVPVPSLTITGGLKGSLSLISERLSDRIGKGLVLFTDLDGFCLKSSVCERVALANGSRLPMSSHLMQSKEDLCQVHSDALDCAPNVKAIVIKQVDVATGLVLPTQEIIALAKARGILTVLDMSESLGQVPIDISAVNPDMAILDLSRWLGAPTGVGALYSANNLGGEENLSVQGKMALNHIASMVALPRAIEFNQSVGVTAINERRNFLAGSLRDRLRAVDRVELSPINDGLMSGTVALKFSNKKSRDLAASLLENYRILVDVVQHNKAGEYLSICPKPFMQMSDLKSLAEALLQIA